MPNNLCNYAPAIAFVKKYEKSCMAVAIRLEVPVENILGLAAQESQYGQGRIASELNNYFSMHAPSNYQIGVESAKKDPKTKVSKFASFEKCADSFADRFGPAVKGKKDPAEFAQALIKVGFNSGNSSNGGRTGFAMYLVDIIHAVKVRLSC
jgi:flagellum-specific peptidoglycan hydrolase FlgJ